MPANPVEREPVLTTAVAALLSFLAARYGFDLDPDQAAAAAGLVLTFLAPFARQLVRPTGTAVELTAQLEHTSPPMPPLAPVVPPYEWTRHTRPSQ